MTAVTEILKRRFSNLTVMETVKLAEEIVSAVTPFGDITGPVMLGVQDSKCGHGRLHVFCGDCSPLSFPR